MTAQGGLQHPLGTERSHPESCLEVARREPSSLTQGIAVATSYLLVPAYVDKEGRVPPVVSRRRRDHPHLADDLRPQMQRVLRRLPSGKRQRREGHRASPPDSTTSATSSTKHKLQSSPGSAELARREAAATTPRPEEKSVDPPAAWVPRHMTESKEVSMPQGQERTKEQLYREAKRLNVKGRSKMNKGQLKAALERRGR